MTKRLLSALLALPFLAAACAAPTDDAATAQDEASETAGACEALSPRTTPLELFVQPDVGAAPFEQIIGRATTSIDVMVYQMGFGPVLDGLIAKARAGVHVRVILDLAQERVNKKYKEKLEEAGATVIWSDPRFTFMHAKVIMVDGREALLSTGNYHQSYMMRERNFAVLDRDADDLASLKEIFEADFARQTPDVSCTRLVVAPVNARARLLELIRSARTSIEVESMQLGDRDVRSALVERKTAGVDVRVLLADPSWIDANAGAAEFLHQHGITPRWYPHVHVKTIMVDGRAAYVGSVNISWNSIDRNREIGVVATEPANLAAARATFEHDWAAATPF
ncbi:MAG: hypothetical protein KIT84_09065 [Labilithrix sp.]|nr:hypothetical protein [Labilithrix sp.]MCW5811150.1 hypothetical protein [Labilithrix sp.]